MKIIITEEQIKKIIKEGTNRGEVYYYSDKIKEILSSNKINLSSNLGSDRDKFGNRYFFLSLSRTPGVNIGYGKTHNERLVLDGNKLNQNFKSIPVDYWKGNSDRYEVEYEYEDRIVTDKPVIDNISKYIIRIEIVTTSFDNETFYENCYKILELAKQRNIPVFFYENKKDLRLKQNIINDKIENYPNISQHSPDTLENKLDDEQPKYQFELMAILSIVLYEKDILDNKQALEKRFNKLTELYNLPELDLNKITWNMTQMIASNTKRNDKITFLENQLYEYFRRGKGDKFRNWIKILTNEMKKFKVTSIEDLVKLKYENNENNNN
jgi:hypothetical protein